VGVAAVDLGRIRGLALFKGKGPRFRHIAAHAYYVPSASGTGGYVVDLAKNTCTCPAHEETGTRCKHQWAASFFRDGTTGPDVETVVPDEPPRPTYPQNWPAYNRAQCEEKLRVQLLLRSLCEGIEQPHQRIGRPRLRLRDAVYGATMKVYGTMSGRRSTTDLRACEAAGHVARAPSYNTLFKYVEQPGLMPLLKRLVDESSRPLASVERAFAADGTGFATQTYVRWHDYRHGEDRRVQRWVKAHAMVGTLTNVVTAIEVTEGSVNDSPILESLLERTAANGFDMREVSADKAYLSHANLAHIERAGAQPYIPFKSNSGGQGSAAWERLYHLYALNREDFMKHYHKRSNVESTFSAIKRKFGAGVRSRTVAAQFNEVLLKCLCHNLSMLVHSIHELNIDPRFWSASGSPYHAGE
jgi:transposase